MAPVVSRIRGSRTIGNWMRKLPLLLLLFFASTAGVLRAQDAPAPESNADVLLIDRPNAQDWLTDIDDGWRVHDGDNPAYARPDFDDSKWSLANLSNFARAQPGWRWYRLRVKLAAKNSQLALLIEGGKGTYAIYVNGIAVPGPHIRSSFGVKRPTERTLALDVSGGDLEIALRTHTPPSYAAWRLPLFLTASIGTPDAIENERQALESGRLYAALPAIFINLLLMLAGMGAIALNCSQPAHTEYRWLGLYLFLLGTADLLWDCQVSGLLPLSANFLVGDPLLYAVAIAQIQFTFSFGGRRVSVPWRIYEALLLTPLLLVWLTWRGQFPSTAYVVIEAIILVPVAVLLPVLLFVWYRRGNREAGWLILPSLLPAATISLNDLGTLSIFFGWQFADFLDNPIQLGPTQLQPLDLGNLLFLLAVAIVMFIRFTRVSREQARSAAELAAAREIQQRLVPTTLPALAGCRIEAIYLPAQEVGGDFYQVIEQSADARLIVVGDVSGKGLKAAMTGALAIGALRTLASANLGPAAILSQMNTQMVQAHNDGFITCLCLRLDPSGTVTLANAGHLSPYWNGEEIALVPALPLGLSADMSYAERTIRLEPKDTLTLLSDGVVEAMNPAGQLFGFERTRDLSTQSAQSIAEAAQSFGQEDDITVLTLAWTGAPLPA